MPANPFRGRFDILEFHAAFILVAQPNFQTVGVPPVGRASARADENTKSVYDTGSRGRSSYPFVPLFTRFVT
jgi:hypothetical protein